jgi:anaerobic selenocysteine-containing dehydrogenase
MDRRSFFKIVGTASGGILTGACGKQAREIMPMLVPEKEIVPGVEEWHPSVCRECGAGCGTIVRVMEAERQIDLDGEQVRERIAAIKKIEGNPLDPVSGGRLCARGQAAVQSLYHPDRLRIPQRRSGNRGGPDFMPVPWDQALSEAASLFEKAVAKDASRIVLLTRPQAGSRSVAIASFLRAIGAPPASTIGLCDFTIERKAAELAFGWRGLPVYEIQDADLVFSLGADFLGGWISPVFYARRFGHMRQGRPGRRGRLIHAESRFSLTAGNADQWLPVQPGGEHALALAVGHVLVTEKLTSAVNRATAGLRDSFASVALDRAAESCGLPIEQIRELARSLGRSEAPVVVAGASIVQTNSLEAIVAANALNWLLGNVGRTGGVLPPPPDPAPDYAGSRPRFHNLLEDLEKAELVVLDGVNPVYAMPETQKLLSKAPAVISFSSFVDDSSAYADLILPDHASLESGEVIVPETAPMSALTGARPFVQPLHETRSTEEVLVELSKKLDRTFELETPEQAFRRLFEEQKPGGDWSKGDEFAAYHERQGGWWAEPKRQVTAEPPASVPPLRDLEFDGNPPEFPLHFQPYPSVQFRDGSGAHLPWMQELPDPTSSAMWGLPVEIDSKTAADLGVENGQSVRVISPHGHLEASVYVNPAAIPGVVSMAIGEGHKHYGRYASGRGANPLAIIATTFDRQTGVAAFGATRVRLEKSSRRGRLVQFSMMDREPEIRRR